MASTEHIKDGRDREIRGNWTKMIAKIDSFLRSHTSRHCLIVFFCKAGRHRSVALARAFGEILEGQGLTVQIEHLSEPSLWRGCQGRCDVCQLLHAHDRRTYQHAVDAMSEIWHRTSEYLAPLCRAYRPREDTEDEEGPADKRRRKLVLRPKSMGPVATGTHCPSCNS